MYSRIFAPSLQSSILLLGPRGTGKSSWLRTHFPKALYLDLLESELYTRLLASPGRLEDLIPKGFKDWVVIDEIQKVPQLLDEVHRLIEKNKTKFILTGSSARKLKKQGTNLLAGRASTYEFFPLTAPELKEDFNLTHSLRYGHLPLAYTQEAPALYLSSYVKTYLQEEIQQEGLTRNLPAFSRFLEAASYSQASLINLSSIARDCEVHRKVVEDYFTILRDTLVSFELPVFSKKAKRELIKKRKFFFFDVGVFRTLRPKGPLDAPEESEGIALESLVVQEVRAWNAYYAWEFNLYFWHTRNHVEVDLVLYGKRGLIALEVKRGSKIRTEDLKGLKLFKEDYPVATTLLLYGGTKRYHDSGVDIIPVQDFLEQQSLKEYLN